MLAFGQLSLPPPLFAKLAFRMLNKNNTFYFILIDTKHFLFFHFHPYYTKSQNCTIPAIISFEAFNDSMYGTYMVSFYFSLGTRQPRYYI